MAERRQAHRRPGAGPRTHRSASRQRGLVRTAQLTAVAALMGAALAASGALVMGEGGSLRLAAALLPAMAVLLYAFVRLFRDAIGRLEGARRELEARVAAQDQTQRQLLDSRQRLATLLDHAPMAVMIFDKDTGALHYMNLYAREVQGGTPDGPLRRDELFSDEPYTEATLLEYIHMARDHGDIEMQWRTKAPGREPMWWAVRLDTILIDGQCRVVAFAQEITQRLEAEQALNDHREHLEAQVKARTAELLVQQHRLKTVIEALPLSLSIKDLAGRYVLCNRVFEETVGMSKSTLLGNTAEELFPPSLALLTREHDEALLRGADIIHYEKARMQRDGSRRDHIVTKVPLRDADGRPEAILTVAVDITEQKTMQRELASAKTEAERLARIKSDFLANMSHEIRTPLHGVLGLVQVARQCPPGDPKVKDMLDRVARSGRHLLGVINDILDFSKIDADKLTVEQSVLDARHLAEDAVAMVEERAAARGLALRLVCEEGLRPVRGDPLRIRQVLLNLLGNAIKFTDQGGVTLTLSTNRERFYFSVRDTGVGIPHDAQERIFSPFEQADGSTSRRFGGTGLGLSISRKLALLMGGDLTLHSTPGEGSVFTLALPAAEADAAPPPPASTQADHAAEQTSTDVTAEAPRLNGLRVLAADDADINRDILKGLLGQHGAQVHCAADGLDALAIHEAQGDGFFDLVLMDLQMPGMDGLQATERLRLREPGLPVVALTAHATPDERQRCTDAGMVGHLAKPFGAQEVVRLILRHARRAPLPAPHAPRIAPPPPADCESALSSPAMASTMSDDLDLGSALARCGGQEALLHKLITRFIDEQADFSGRCQRLLALDAKEAQRTAHRLKGTSANLGLPVLARHAGELETALASGDAAAIGRALLALNMALQQHITLLRRWLDEHVPA